MVGSLGSRWWLWCWFLIGAVSAWAQTTVQDDRQRAAAPVAVENPFRQAKPSGESANRATRDASTAGRPSSQNTSGSAAVAEAPPTSTSGDVRSSTSASASSTLTKEHITRQIELITPATELDDATRADLVKRLQKAADLLVAADEAGLKAAQYAAEIQQSPKLISDAKATLAQSVGDPVVEPSPGMQLLQVEQQVAQSESKLNGAKSELTKRETELKRRPDRHTELTRQVFNQTQQLDELQKQRAGPPPNGENPLVTQVRQMEQEARQLLYQRQLDQFKLELQRIDALTELAPLQRDLAQRSVVTIEKEVAAWQQIVADVRKDESRRQAEEARRQAEHVHPALSQFPLAQRNGELAEKRKAIAVAIERATAESKQMNKRLTQLKGEFEKLQEKVQVAGLSKTIGILLRKQRTDLHLSAEPLEFIRFIERELPSAQLTLIELEDERSLLSGVEQAVQEVVTNLKVSMPECDHLTVVHMASSLLTAKRALLDSLINDYNTYLRELGELELSCRRLIAETGAFANFIDKHVLWIRSMEPVGPRDLERAANSLVGWASAKLWMSMGEKTLNGLVRRPVHGAAALLLVLTLALMRRHMFNRVDRLSQSESGNNALHFLPTMEAIAWVVLASSVWPCLMWCAGWWLESSERGTDASDALSNALAHGLQRGAAFLWLFQLVRVCTRSGGIGEAHFGWHASGTKVVRESLAWLGAIGIPIAVVVSVADRWDEGQGNDPLGRLAFIAGMVITATAMHNIFRRQKGMLQEALARNPSGWLNRVRIIGYLGGMGIPCVLSVLSAAGYYYSARQLAIRFELTMLIVVSLVGMHGVLSRWFLVKRRNIAIRQARERRQNQVEQPTELKGLQPPPIPERDMTLIQSQLQYLLRYGATLAVLVVTWFVWADVLPALRILDRVVLWTSRATVIEHVPDSKGEMKDNPVEREVPTTLTHALLAMLLAAGTFVLGKNFPALLEITVLDRLPIDHGGRHALAIILRYLVYLAGLLLVCRTVSVSWSSVQWLAAAMTVGLGFGLQEIFANLVSGLIILFERPLRVGDLVTVNGVTGTVTRMQIRATTITDADRREMIVPNKKFITEDVINWTLSDTISRVTIEVGVGYGSDTRLAHSILMRAAKQHPLVLTDPEPMALFKRFGESTLDFSLHVFIPSRNVYGTVVHDLHTTIDKEFRDAAIEIAFPQRDVNIRSISPNAFPTLAEVAKLPKAA